MDIAMLNRPNRSPAELRRRADLAALIFQAKLRLRRDRLSTKFDPDQPRVPAGSAEGGQ